MALYPELLRAYRSTNLGSFMLLTKNAQFGIKSALDIQTTENRG